MTLLNSKTLGKHSVTLTGVVSSAGVAVADLGALTSSQSATTNASAPGVGYVQAEAASTATLANALKVNYNAAQVDIASLRTKLNELLDSLQAAGIIAP